MLTRPHSFDALQATLPDRVTSHQFERGTLLVLPSLSFPAEELAKITAIERYEERLLHLALLLREPDVRVVYVTSLPIDPAIIDYYLAFLPDPSDARRRLSLVDLGGFSGRGLAADLSADRAALTHLRDTLGDDVDDAVILPFNVTDAERRVAVELGVPLFAARPELVGLGSKTGSRRIARAAGVPVLPGVEDLWSPAEISAAVDELRLTHPHITAVVVKLNNGFSGQGNAMVHWDGDEAHLAERETVFCAPGETWTSFTAKIAREGAIVEQLVTDRVASPSAQAWISPTGAVEVVSTHDQMLGGPGRQVYLGCRFPAAAEHRADIVAHTRAVGVRLADAGVTGPFAIDFMVLDEPHPRIRLSEINLRLGGTTHPFGMARTVTAAHGGAADGLHTADGLRVYVASDNLKEPGLIGSTPAEVVQRVRDARVAFDPASRTGVTLHLLGAVREHGKLGAVAVGRSDDHADALFARLVSALRG